MVTRVGQLPHDDPSSDVPMRPARLRTRGDRTFIGIATAATSVSFVIILLALVFLIDKARPAFAKSGIVNFFTTSVWNPFAGKFGVLGLLEGTMVIALIALVVGVPMGVSMALFINEYAPAALRRPLTSVIDLLAALPSILFGMWGLSALSGRLSPIAKFLGDHLSVLPFLRTGTDPQLVRSSFIAGVVVGIMIVPIIASVSRDVMAQAPREQCEGALALGGTRWGMIREVILPFGRSGIVGASLLGFGRALGETIAVALLISPMVNLNGHVLTSGAGSIAAHIAIYFGEAGPLERSGLVAAGLALFLLTLVVNLVARMVVRRSAYVSV
jgi:phosphate transport system permease protein